MDIKRFRRKATIEAVKVTFDNAREVAKWCGGTAVHSTNDAGEETVSVAPRGHTRGVANGGWIFKNNAGNFGRCSDALLMELYELLEDDQ